LATHATHSVQQFFGLGISFVPIDHAIFGALITEKHVFSDGKIRNKCKFLMDNNETSFFRMMDILKPAFLAFKIDFPLYERMDRPAQNLHQGRFSGSVFTDQSMNLTLLDTEIYIIKCLTQEISW